MFALLFEESTNVLLNTERRHEERSQWEQERFEVEQEQAEIERQKQLRREQEELEQLRELRKKAVPRAQPIRKYTSVRIQRSDKVPTSPHSPQFSNRPRRVTPME